MSQSKWCKIRACCLRLKACSRWNTARLAVAVGFAGAVFAEADAGAPEDVILILLSGAKRSFVSDAI